MSAIKFIKSSVSGKLVRPQGYGFPVGLGVGGYLPLTVEYLVVGGGGAGGTAFYGPHILQRLVELALAVRFHRSPLQRVEVEEVLVLILLAAQQVLVVVTVVAILVELVPQELYHQFQVQLNTMGLVEVPVIVVLVVLMVEVVLLVAPVQQTRVVVEAVPDTVMLTIILSLLVVMAVLVL